MGPTADVVPALLRASVLWSFRLRRVALPLEHLELQGWAMFDSSSGPQSCQCIGAFRQLSDQKLRQLAGNGMHLAVIGSVLAFALDCTEVA